MYFKGGKWIFIFHMQHLRVFSTSHIPKSIGQKCRMCPKCSHWLVEEGIGKHQSKVYMVSMEHTSGGLSGGSLLDWRHFH